MLDYLAIFTKGGALLWAWQLGQLRGDPVGALIRGCLLEDRAGERAFAYALPGGGGYTVKWSLHNVRRGIQTQLFLTPPHKRFTFQNSLFRITSAD